MSRLDYGVRLDQFDYEGIGVMARWYYHTTLFLLTSFEMEIKGYFSRPNAELIYEKIYRKYDTFLSQCLFEKRFDFHDGNDAETRAWDALEGVISYDKEWASFDKNVFLSYLRSNDHCRVDVDRLERFLRGEEVPLSDSLSHDHDSDTSTRAILKPIHQEGDQCNRLLNGSGTIPDMDKADDSCLDPSLSQEYRFEKVGKSWNIIFGNIRLRGIKHKTGMDYIKLLLQSPRHEISSLDIEALLNPEGIEGIGKRIAGDTFFSVGDEELDKIPSGKSFDDDYRKREEQLALYKQQLHELNQRRKEAEENNNDTEIDRVEELLAFCEQEINNIIRNKDDDPELEKSRKRVFRNITSALDEIKSEEITQGLNKTPVYHHLNSAIRTGKTCEYNPPLDDEVCWRF